MAPKASHVRKHAGKSLKPSKRIKNIRSQKIKDQKSMRSLDQAMAAGILNLKPTPSVADSQRESWKDALKSIENLAEQSATAKSTKSSSKLSRKIDSHTLTSLMSGIGGIKVDGETLNDSLQSDDINLSRSAANNTSVFVTKPLSISKKTHRQSSVESEIDI